MQAQESPGRFTMSRQIPRNLLPHTGKYAPYNGTVSSVKTYGTEVDLLYVRFEPVKQNAMTSLGEMKNDSFIMFYDPVNSSPSIVPKINDKITAFGVARVVRKVTTLFTQSSTVHHYEVNLV